MARDLPALYRVDDPSDIHRELALPDPPAGRPYVIVNVVSSLDGRATAHDGSAAIASRADRAVMRRIRSQVDIVLCGAGTWRRERVGAGLVTPSIGHDGAPRRAPRLAVAAGTQPLTPLDPRDTPSARPLAIVGADAPPSVRASAEAWADVAVVPGAFPDPDDILRAVGEVRHVLLEGGPRLLHAFLVRGLVDEMFVTIAPRILAGDGPRIAAGLPIDTRLVARAVYLYQSELYARYRVETVPV